ncbi:MAG TPA: carboxypeptidase-like regulatory domain-containing protein [Gemmatimonadaceae bacterium]|nr:carboxypeptidase-like regulatory domain-containing protein [Gemmatimonadaceae bacterium]
MRLPTTAALAALLGALAAAPLRAQTVSGRVTDASAGRPAVGAIVSLVTPDGRRLGAVLTAPDGAYRIGAPRPGSYRLRVDLIGYESWRSPALELRGADTLTYDVRLPLRRVELETVVVSGTARCTVNPQAVPQMLATWEEIRRALTISEIGRREHLLPFELRLTERVMSGRGELAGSRRRSRLRGTAMRPWEAPPAAELAAHGYVQRQGDRLLWFGPTVETLLSDAFLTTHCFRPVRDDDQVGLAFTPLPDRTLPDIAGTIWLDARTSELRRVDFVFEHTADSLANGEPAGGRLEFARLPSGLWHISRWRLRVPLVANSLAEPDSGDADRTRRRRRTWSLIDARFRESSGETVVLTPDGEADEGTVAVVAGVVTDSTTGEPLAGVQVVAPGAEPMVTDGAGRYALEIADVPESATSYAVTFDHPRFAALGLRATSRVVRIQAGSMVTLNFAVPAVATLLRQACPLNGEATTDASGRLRLGMLLGQVTTADGAPLPVGVEVVAEWASDDAAVDPTSGVRVVQQRGVAPRPDGGFHLCPLPIGREVTLQARQGGRVLASVPLVVPASGLARYTLVLTPTAPR